jgi:hypothetical protein
MTTRLRRTLVLGSALATFATTWMLSAAVGPASAQQGNLPPSGLNNPSIPARGEWFEVLTVTERWLVLRNEQGQQFPVAFDAVQTFVMRWPTTLDRLGPNDLVEITGFNQANNEVIADHADVFRGSAQNLVTPTIQQIIGFNRVLTPFDLERQRLLGISYQYILSPVELAMPLRMHIVAPPVSMVPLQLAISGNNVVTVVPSAGGMSLAEVTPGVPSFVRPGDVAYAVPTAQGATPRTLVLSQLVIYKAMPVDQFAR